MWPWGHLVVGYVLLLLVVRATYRRAPGGTEAIALAVGTQFPDLVDKPLAWYWHVLPNGRSLAHSALTAAVVTIVVGALLVRRDRPTVAVAFGLGYWSHLLGDAVGPLVAGAYDEVAFLAWPLLPPVEYAAEPSFAAHLSAIEPTPGFLLELGLFVAVAGLWIRDGCPGLREPLTAIAARLRPSEE